MQLPLLLALLGQFNPHAPDPRLRRAIREQAVVWAGPKSRELVETGDEAALALLACSPSGARNLVQFHASGALGELPRPPDLLRVVSMTGDEALFFAIQHTEELRDKDMFDAYLFAPLDYALGLKKLDQGAAEVRAGKLAYFEARSPPWSMRTISFWGGIVAIAGLLVWRWRRNSV